MTETDEIVLAGLAKKLLATPPKPNADKPKPTDADHKKKPGGPFAKKDRPEAH